jgi:hypothetical protein
MTLPSSFSEDWGDGLDPVKAASQEPGFEGGVGW